MPTIRFNSEFPGYEILGEIGRSNARILKARNLSTNDLVAIKHFALNTDKETLRRFQREAQIMTEVRDFNVVEVKEVCLEAPLPYIVMEWVQGGDLRGLLNEQKQLDITTTIRLGLQMSKAFKAIHPKGIVHRDIKPENILYRKLPSGEFHFLLTDFGIARLKEQSMTMTGHSMMTLEYASPEQFDDPRNVGLATDYYSLGVVLYESLIGKPPFALETNVGMATFMNKVINVPPPILQLEPPKQLPTSLQHVLTTTLAKKPTERLSNAGRLELLLEQARMEVLQVELGIDMPLPKLESPRGDDGQNKTIPVLVEPDSKWITPDGDLVKPKSVVESTTPKPVLVSIDGRPVDKTESSSSSLEKSPTKNEGSPAVYIFLSIVFVLIMIVMSAISYNNSNSDRNDYTPSVDSTATMLSDTVYDESEMVADSAMAMDSSSTMAADSVK